MVLQVWGAYGTIWPVVHQQLGVRPDMGRRKLEVTPQVPPQYPKGLSGENIRLGTIRGRLGLGEQWHLPDYGAPERSTASAHHRPHRGAQRRSHLRHSRRK